MSCHGIMLKPHACCDVLTTERSSPLLTDEKTQHKHAKWHSAYLLIKNCRSPGAVDPIASTAMEIPPVR